ncbi:2-oxo-4-hydroxy-4-carboxy-5-ureidoimidazoline decarboxylase [Roseomonas haemaphysalidis]|uniref:2-oxo-4-hydroxy-4-carboxy-5-ureidoimidazoline decarboxylase n=1 Tax=Roseomonas haemaphysalidis TaxID=2768162 RepID=A0ABS3KRH0_9PROT|nr:2-oxo-4-hydroxy-4-carboxy-5-ureidoimidazoline decarboxylase [Roseomonas haemaphysalidis]MBO1080080.1 2-oxo-4-hydroxy-4-carboxy-5-ureidoimidazoline decarboxylase [Roseomonas haemaphysalidis]
MTTLAALNAASAGGFASALDGIFERAPWVAADAAAARPFADASALHTALMRALENAGEAAFRAFLNGHEPLVAGPLPDSLTASSRLEQGDLPLGALIGADALAALNAAYRQRFGFPFVVALRRRTAADVLRELHRRLAAEPAAEWPQALAEVGHVTRFRLLARLGEPVPGGSIRVELAGPVRALVLEREGQVIARMAAPAGGGVTLWREAPLRLGAYRLLADGRPHDFRPEQAEGETVLPLRGPASG